MSRARDPPKCPVCWDALPSRTQRRPNVACSFQCGHQLCLMCDAELLDRHDHRCPVCRAPRIGLTAEEAEPPQDRHMGPPFHEELETMFQDEEQGEVVVTRMGDGRMYFARRMGPHDPPPPHTQGTAQTLHSALRHAVGEDNHTALESTLPSNLLDGLLNVPSMDLAAWHAERRAQALLHRAAALRQGSLLSTSMMGI